MSEWKLVPVNPTAGMIDAAYETVLTQGELLSSEAYHAMLAAAPVPTAADCTSVCDAYAAENQQFSDELTRLRAEVEALREALKKLSQGLDCGCVPCTGTCKNQESLLDVIRERQQIARRALEGK